MADRIPTSPGTQLLIERGWTWHDPGGHWVPPYTPSRPSLMHWLGYEGEAREALYAQSPLAWTIGPTTLWIARHGWPTGPAPGGTEGTDA